MPMTYGEAMAQLRAAKDHAEWARAAAAPLDESATAYLRMAIECCRYAERALEFSHGQAAGSHRLLAADRGARCA